MSLYWFISIFFNQIGSWDKGLIMGMFVFCIIGFVKVVKELVFQIVRIVGISNRAIVNNQLIFECFNIVGWGLIYQLVFLGIYWVGKG